MNKKLYLKFAVMALLVLPLLLTGCINSAVSDGVIKGRLYVYEGNQPALNPVKVRIEALPGTSDDSLKRLNFRYTIIEPSGHGEYVINNVPPGEYTLQFNIQGKDNAVAYFVGLGNLPPSDGGSTANGSDNSDIPKAFIESGRTYEMPDYYIKKVSQSGSGTFKGNFVYSPLKIPLENLTISLTKGNDKKYAQTNKDGVAIIPELSTGSWTLGFMDSSNNIYDWYFSSQSTSVPISENYVYEQTYVLKYGGTNLPTIRGLINLPKNMKLWISPENDIKAYLSIQDVDGGNSNPITINTGCYFEEDLQPWISKYQLNVTMKEPYSSNTVIYAIPGLNPGEVHTIPDNSLNIDIAHKMVNVQIYPPQGSGVTPSGEVIIKITINGTDNNFIGKAAGQYWMASVDLPYSLATFDCTTELKIGTTKLHVIPIDIPISETSGDVVKVFYEQPPATGGGGTP